MGEVGGGGGVLLNVKQGSVRLEGSRGGGHVSDVRVQTWQPGHQNKTPFGVGNSQSDSSLVPPPGHGPNI